MAKPLKLTVGFLISVVIIALVYFIFFKKSGYTLSPMIESSDLTIVGKDAEPGDYQSLPYNLGCVPGPQADASPYTRSLTPGGYCGIQKFVSDQADYKISGGIGESLLA
jgi:hypothetical protein